MLSGMLVRVYIYTFDANIFALVYSASYLAETSAAAAFDCKFCFQLCGEMINLCHLKCMIGGWLRARHSLSHLVVARDRQVY